MTRHILCRNPHRCTGAKCAEPAYHVYDDHRRLIGEVYHPNPRWSFAKPSGLRIVAPSFQRLKELIRDALRYP